MTAIRGFDFPDDLYYLVAKHVWVQPMGEGRARVGLTPVAYRMLRNSLVAISVRHRVLGQEVVRGKNVAMVESMKYNGPLAAPFAGVVLSANTAVTENPSLAEADPYGSWIVEMQPLAWNPAADGLLTGVAALAAYRALLEVQNLSAEG